MGNVNSYTCCNKLAIFQHDRVDMVRHCAIWLLVFSSVYLGAQTPKYPVISLPVVRNGVNLTNAWTGGFDAPEFSSADINGDGIKDLFVFDRSGNKVMVFINGSAANDTTFHYAPEYEHLFPSLTTWAVLRDYNGDGIPDIFTNQPGETLPGGRQIPAGVEVYKGSNVLGNLHFDVDQYCLYYKNAPYTINLVPNSNGVPAFVDVNHDGALDILTFDIYGSTGVYYENIVAQLGLPADSMVFSEESECWGNFYVSGNTLDVQLGVSCKGGAPYNPQGNERHTGATLWPVEYGNDDNVDVLVSGAHISNMIFMKNTGTADNANIGWVDTIWPRCSMPVNSPLFPAAFQIDGNNDGHNDLLIAPNFGYPNPAMNTNNVQFYERVTGDTCGYHYNGNDTFLVHTMLDFGSDSKVALFDYNGDSLMDLVVGNLFYYDPVVAAVSRLALYQNIGTPTQPKFQEVSTDYMGLSAYNQVGIYPAFGDLDGDGKKDMLIGDANGDIDFFKNVGGSVASFPAMTAQSYFGINVGSNAAPFIYDMNNDGLPDLVIGKGGGTVSYYWNFGTLTHPLFSVDSVDSTFGHVDVMLASATSGNSQPFIMRDNTGALLLCVGSAQGLVYEYLIDTTHLRNGNFTQLDSNFLQHTVGANATMQAYDLNGDGKMEYVTGCSRGGLQLFSETVWDSSVILSDKTVEPVNNNIRVFPNPANEQLKCVLPDVPGAVIQPQVLNLLGQHVAVPYSFNQNVIVFDTQQLVTGMYVVRVMVGEYSYSAKIIVEH